MSAISIQNYDNTRNLTHWQEIIELAAFRENLKTYNIKVKDEKIFIKG